MSQRWLKVLVPPVGILVAYFTVPMDAQRAPIGVLAGLVLSFTACAVVVVIVIREAARTERRLSAFALILALQVTLVAFSLVYYILASNETGEFEGMATRLDALYFSTTTAATVGYGDIHAAGQLARALVTVNMIFNLVFIAGLLNLAKEEVSNRRRQGAPTQSPDDRAADE